MHANESKPDTFQKSSTISGSVESYVCINEGQKNINNNKPNVHK